MNDKNRKLVTQALDELFQKRDLAAVDRHFAADYRQHNPLVGNGSEGLRAFAAAAVVPNPGFSAKSSHVLADGELVAVRSRYTGFGPKAYVGFDLFRVQGDKLAEHWDCLEEDRDDDGGAFDGSAPEHAAGDSNASRALVEAFVTQVLVGKNFQRFGDFVAETPRTAALRAEAATTGAKRLYERLHRTLADGELVLSQAEGVVDGRAHALYDLFRVNGGKIVDRWGVAQEVPASTASGLGMF
jgi:predicted SnoaL-like aldol condensation-catalyzing enzyme